ncbi:M20/M25/M40 family metallo-hydrolase [Hymenobacter terrestris]|uniref:M20/M25/M40 family metallo-hydrolase n=1 Tax=Hymenobacter terrestris TaxID=2748310 RepID=A0ABX2Q4B3_9BACT|nr:M20/M25/M40 family metallo-hydrolase [Hymenobacter terrestris]NVO85792.1 M20/M25/M40 family metallo-hydrolase [Hymenobacter terrestris]
MYKAIALILLLGLAGRPVFAQKKPVKLPAAPGVAAATVERIVRTLAADDMQGRASGKPGAEKAGDFLVAEFQRIGLEPLPGLPGFSQSFPVYEARTKAMLVTVGGTVVPASRFVLVSGQPKLNWMHYDEPSPRIVTIGPKDNLMKEIRPLLNPQANTIVFVDSAQQAAFKRVASAMERGGLRADKPAPFSTLLVLGKAPVGAFKFLITATTDIRTVQLRNVVGVLPGLDKDRENEKVIFSAHYDHIGALSAVAGDSIANGADDDASGTTAVVALAEYFKQQRSNARPLVFVAFVAEEIGGFGAGHFARQLDAAQVVAMFNIEMIGKQAKFGPNSAFITGFDKSDFGPLLQRNAKGTVFRFEADPYPEQNLFYRSDNATLARLGVPAHTISTDQIPTDKLYHSVNDEVESLDLPNMTAVITAIARAAAPIINGQQTPTRIVGEEAKK